MSRENVEVVRKLYDSLTRGEFLTSALSELFDPGLEFERVGEGGAGLAGRFHGLDGLVKATREWLDAFDDVRAEVREIIDAGSDTVVVRLRQRATAKASGMPIDKEFTDVLKLRDGRIVVYRSYWDPEEGLAAAGLTG